LVSGWGAGFAADSASGFTSGVASGVAGGVTWISCNSQLAPENLFVSCFRKMGEPEGGGQSGQ
jgi:hypothetical protein